jgi:hypothetical protein
MRTGAATRAPKITGKEIPGRPVKKMGNGEMRYAVAEHPLAGFREDEPDPIFCR